MFLTIFIAFRVPLKLHFMCTYNLMTVWWHRGSWHKGYYLQFVVQWWWGYGAWLSIGSWGWYFFWVFCFCFVLFGFPTPLFSFFFFLSIISDEVDPVTWWFQDIRTSGETKKIGTIPAWKTINEQHIAHQFHYSLRVKPIIKIIYLNQMYKKSIFA